MATDSELVAAGWKLPTGDDYIRYGDDAISANARKAADLIDRGTFFRGNIAAGTSLDTLGVGALRIVVGYDYAVANNLPEPSDGVLDHASYGIANQAMQIWTPRASIYRSWYRFRNTTGWQAWQRVDPVRQHPESTTGVNVDTLFTMADIGIWEVNQGATLGLPPGWGGRGTLEVSGVTIYGITQRATSRNLSRVWTRTCQDPNLTPAKWSPWSEVGSPLLPLPGYVGVAGDSLAASHNLVESLGTQLPSVNVYSRAWNGETSDGVLVRLGARPLHVTVTGGTIPATGSVAVTTPQVLSLTGSDSAYTGMLVTANGVTVDGKLQWTASTQTLIFTRATDGQAVPASGPTRFDPQWAANTRGHTLVVTMGRNDVSLGSTGADPDTVTHVLANYQRMAEWLRLSSQFPQFVFLGTLNRFNEPAGHPKYATVKAINAALAQMFPGHYLDMRDYIVNQAIHDLGITPTPEDLANIANDCPPPSVMADMTHYTDEAAAAFTQHRLAPWLIGQGYVTAP